MPTLASRFELPALNLNFGSITDGTNIPPPPDSPVLKVPTPPQTPPPAEVNKKVKEVNEQSKPASTNEGQSQSNGSLATANGTRPTSQSGSSFADERKSKRSSGWFRRIRTGDSGSRRSSTILVGGAPPTPTFNKKPSGPPPPMIPELADLEKDEGSLGTDLFKNIK